METTVLTSLGWNEMGMGGHGEVLPLAVSPLSPAATIWAALAAALAAIALIVTRDRAAPRVLQLLAVLLLSGVVGLAGAVFLVAALAASDAVL